MMGKRESKSRRILRDAMEEVHENEPSTVARAKASTNAKEKMRKAIAFSKARKAGAHFPKPKNAPVFVSPEEIHDYRTEEATLEPENSQPKLYPGLSNERALYANHKASPELSVNMRSLTSELDDVPIKATFSKGTSRNMRLS